MKYERGTVFKGRYFLKAIHYLLLLSAAWIGLDDR